MEENTDNRENGMTQTDDSKVPPKFNIPSQIDYSAVNFVPLNGTQIQRNVITDTYVTASQNEDEMVRQIDNALSVLKPKRKGFAGYLSFCYLQMTLYYVLKHYDDCIKVTDSMLYCIDCIEKYLFTGNYDDTEGKPTGFINYAFGESDEELKKTVKFLHDTLNTCKMIHAKAASFESGYSLTVAELMLHGYNKQKGMMRSDCEHLREIVEKIRNFIANERDNPSEDEITPSADMEFANIEELQ